MVLSVFVLIVFCFFFSMLFLGFQKKQPAVLGITPNGFQAVETPKILRNETNEGKAIQPRAVGQSQ